jgi:DNA polymerase-3 subunit gamma/tau
VRDIRDSVVYSPADLKYKVYIIDEVHMLSTAAFNALLKTLEEPPEYVIFILATTEINKIPATVLSRCQRFDFHRVSEEVIAKRLRVVCEGEGIDADDDALLLIADLAQGAFRDALNMLEYCSGAGGKITQKSASELLGASSSQVLCIMAENIAARDVAETLSMIAKLSSASRDILVYWRELIGFFRNMLICASTRGNIKKDGFTARAAEKYTVPRIMQVLGVFCDAEENMMRTPASARLFAEMALVRVCDETMESDTESLLIRIAELEKKLDALTSGKITLVQSAPISKTTEEIPLIDDVPPIWEDENASVPPADVQEPIANIGATSASKAEPAVKSTEEKKPAPVRAVSLRGFADVVKKLEALEPSLASFMIGSTAVEKGGKLYIYLENDFAAQFACEESKKSIIARTIADVLGKNYDTNVITPVCVEGDTEEYDAVDELIETNK